MASTVGGTVTWVLDVETGKFTSGLASANASVKSAADNVSTHTDKISSSFKSTATSVGQSLNGMANAVGGLLISTGLAIGTSSVGLLGMAKASWNQVVAVENATFALKAYEKDASKVSDVLAGLVKYAQSDMGVLFQRQDLFDAASTMKLYGIETSKLVDYTKILSKGVAVGKTSFQELSDIMGRVASSGQLTGDAFDMLVMRGIKLPSTMRNAKVSAEELFQALDKSLPDELLTGRANTITGIMTRLQSAFRNLGAQILGVDKDTSQFIKGGLGDTIVNSMKNLRDIMASPAMKESFANLGKTIGNFVKTALPLLIKGFMWIANNLPTLIALFTALGALFVALKVAAAVAFFIGLANPIQWVVIAVVALVGIFTYLQLKFDIFGKAAKLLTPILKFVGDLFKELWVNVKDLASVLGKELAPVFAFVAKHAEVIKKILMVTTAIAFVPLLFVIGSVIAAIKLLSIVIGFIAKHFEVIKKVLIVTTIMAFAPFILIIGSVIVIVKILISVFQWLANMFTTIYNVVVAVMSAIWAFISPILNFILNLYIIVWGTIFLVTVSIMKKVWDIISSVWNTIYGFISNVLGIISNIVSSTFNFMYNIIAPILTNIKNFVLNTWNTIYGIISGIVNKIISFFAPAWNWLYGAGTAIVGGLINGIRAMGGALWNGIAGVSSAIGNFFAGAGGWLWGAGRSIIQGLVNGISSMAGAVYDAANRIASNVKNTISHALNMHSPSRVMFGFGENISQGLAKGIDSSSGQVQASSLGIANVVQAPMVDMKNSGPNVNNNETSININGNIMLGDKSAVDEFFARLNRNNELARKGMALS